MYTSKFSPTGGTLASGSFERLICELFIYLFIIIIIIIIIIIGTFFIIIIFSFMECLWRL